METPVSALGGPGGDRSWGSGVHSDVEQAVFAHVLGSIPLTKEEQVALLRQQPLPMLREILHQLRSGLGRTTAASAAPAASSAALAATTAACRAAAAAGHTQTAVDEGAWQIFEAVFKGTWQQLEMQKQQHKACVRGQAGASAGPGNGGQQPATAPNAASGADATVGRGATTTKPATGIQDKRQQVPRARPAAKGTAAARAQQPLARTQAVKVGSKRAAGMVESAAGPTARQMDDLERPTKRRVVEARAPAAVPAPASARVVMAEPQQPQQHCQQPGQLHRVVLRERPELVLVNGPGTCIPICAAAFTYRVLGLAQTQVVYVESIARTRRFSLSAKLLYHLRMADLLFVQWEQLAKTYPRAVYAGRLY
ncbi:hypothetical protein HYH02_015526 [Chlamydomonas schloesseri]|uniref:UDP-N-acetylglucosamine transferase subunit ALG14 n=1 Tax=Chlamydomonas schloesseri TaxID=2026947 RepID=A0A835S7A0_9CHLO|nr:hypothetical protein HYH02_015526 [Chlamydomonas schloesseri]|eukprot:KAG2422048.1 hypothetical protein HYH02_015526 [Chlamydomonas schloesseri]